MSGARSPRAGGPHALPVAAALLALVAVGAALVVAVATPEELLAAHTLEDVLAAVAWSAVAVALAPGGGPAGLDRLALLVAGCSASAQFGPALRATVPDRALTDAALAWGEWVWLPAAALPLTLVPLALVPRTSGARRTVCRVATVLTLTGLAGTAVAVSAPAVGLVVGGPSVVCLLLSAVTALVLLATSTGPDGAPEGRRVLPVLVAGVVRMTSLLAALAEPGAGPVLQVITAAAVPGALGVVLARDLLAEVRGARHRLLTATTDERTRLTRDLHDDLGPLLSAIGSCADSALVRLSTGRGDVAEPVERLRAVTDDAVVALRRVLADLAPAGPDGAPLARVVRALVHDLGRARGLDPVVDTHGIDDLPEPWRATVLRVVAEGVHNAVRHGRGATVTVLVRRCGSVVELTVTDDGRGFDPDAGTDGHGLASMRARVGAVGGTLTVGSGPAGTVVSARLPVPQRAVV